MSENLTIIALVVIAVTAMIVLEGSQEVISGIAGGLVGYLSRSN